jgi:quercetin dioxygenase-like cupin family protein
MIVPGLLLSTRSESVPWRSTSVRGVSWLLLDPERHAREEQGADAAVLIRMEPGCGYPPHRHVGVEEVLVLAGGYRDESGDHFAGSYVRYEAGSEHAPIALGDPNRAASDENPACVLFAIAREGIEALAPRGVHSTFASDRSSGRA